MIYYSKNNPIALSSLVNQSTRVISLLEELINYASKSTHIIEKYFLYSSFQL